MKDELLGSGEARMLVTDECERVRVLMGANAPSQQR